MNFVVGTAGHINHGKSTLVTALTGIDPDRLAEEKRRGMTIDLGFAHLMLPTGRDIGIVDVPGHAKFIRNMLAGVHGLDAVLLVIAADEGVMPQTSEHLEIIDLLEVKRGLVVLTKTDLVDDEWLALIRIEVDKALQGTSLEGAGVVPVSALTGAGLDDLKGELDRLLDQVEPRADLGRPRLPVDRVFTMSGFGTVVTGTLVDGVLRVGDSLEIVPRGSTARIRGLQQHNHKVAEATPGSRVAVNLIGVEKDEVDRGDVLALPGTLGAGRRIDARVRVLSAASTPLRHGSDMRLHTGTAEVQARVIVIDGDAIEPGHDGWVQLYLDRAIAAAAGDRFVLRIPSPAITLAGGSFVDVDPRKHARHDATVRESLERRTTGDILLEELRKYPRGVTVSALLKATLAPDADIDRIAARRAGDWLFSDESWAHIRDRATSELAAYHRTYPLRTGMPLEELKSRLGLGPAAAAPALVALAADGAIELRGAAAAIPSHAMPDQPAGGPAAKLLELVARQPFAPPSLAEAMREAGAGPEMVRALIEKRELVRLSDDVVFTRDAYDRAVALVREVVASEGSVTVARLRDRMGASRRPVLALLEHLDSARITRRVGDERVLR